VLKGDEEEEENDEGSGVGAVEKGGHSQQSIVFQHSDHAQEEEDVVAEREDEDDIPDASGTEDIDHRQTDGIEDQVRLHREWEAVKADLLVPADHTGEEVRRDKDQAVDQADDEHIEEVDEDQLRGQVRSVLSEDSVDDVVTVIDVGDAFNPELDRCLDGHEEGEEEPSVGEVVAEAVDEEKEDGDELGHHCALDKLGEHDFGSSMGEGSVLEEKVGQPIKVFHLDVCSGEDVGLFVALDQAD